MQKSRWATSAAPAPVSPAATPRPTGEVEVQQPQEQSSTPTVAPTEEAAPLEPEVYAAPIAQEINAQIVPTFDPSMDEFAQTREDDDLFDDDIIPAEPAAAEPVLDTPIEYQQPRVDDVAIPTAPAAHSRGRGGARGRGRGGGTHVAQTHSAPAPPQETKAEVISTTGGTVTETEPASEVDAQDESQTQLTQTPRKEAAVRGDRSGTGGIKKAKLSEAELSARIASIKLKNETLTAAHSRAEADLASFEAREARAAEENQKRRAANAAKQKEDRMNRSQMLGEREKNRQRKMNALTGREWDAEKEEGFGGTGGERQRGAKRGAHGGVAQEPRQSQTDPDDIGEDVNTQAPSGPAFRARGRGGRSRGGRGGRGGRGDANGGNQTLRKTEAQTPPSASDFPDLPQAKASAQQESSAPATLSFPRKTQESKAPLSPDTPIDQIRSWADQVERAERE